MALFLSNVTLETLNVSLLIYDPTCTIGGQPWRKVAWYVILPGQTVVPDVLAVDLRTVNGWVGLYAYTASGSEEWQGSGNAWFAVSNGVHFNQCGDDNTNCPKYVDFRPIFFDGNSDILAYIGPYSGLDSDIRAEPHPLHVTPPRINDMYVNWQPQNVVLVNGMGFVPGTVVMVTFEYNLPDGSGSSNVLRPSFTPVNREGYFEILIPVIITPTGVGKFTTQALDFSYGLSATKTGIE
jgi:hypothetical protein